MGLIVAVDFDGTCVEHEFPKVGKDVPHAARVIGRLADAGHRIVLWTMRSDVDEPTTIDGLIDRKDGLFLTDAVNWFKEKCIPLWGINKNPEQHTWTASPKQYAHLYIDDAALGCPLVLREGRPYVDWLKVEELLIENHILTKN